MRFFKKAKFLYILFSAISIVLGIFLIIFPQTSMTVLCYILGSAAVIFGVIKIASYFSSGLWGPIFQFDLGAGIFLTVVGIFIVIDPGRVSTIIPVIVGVFWIIEGAMHFQTFLDAKRYHLKYRYVTLAFAITTCGCGVFLIFNPFEGINALMILLGISLIIDGAQNLFEALYYSSFTKKVKSDERVIKLDDETEMHF